MASREGALHLRSCAPRGPTHSSTLAGASGQGRVWAIAAVSDQGSEALSCKGVASPVKVKVDSGPEAAKRRDAWEREITSLDEKETELHQTQARLIREHMAHFVQDMSEVWVAIGNLQSSCDKDSLEMQTLREELHRDRQDLRDEIMGPLEGMQRDLSGDKTELREALKRIAKTSVELARMVSSLSVLGGRLHEVQTRLALCEQGNALLQPQKERLDNLERLLGDLTDRHAPHSGRRCPEEGFTEACTCLGAASANHNETLKFVREFARDLADRHAEELKQVRLSHESLKGRLMVLEGCGTIADLLTTCNGLSVQRGEIDAPLSALQDRVDNLETTCGDVSSRQAREQSAIKVAHEKQGATLLRHASRLDACAAQHESHAALFERVNSIQKYVGDLAERHAVVKAELQTKLSREQVVHEQHCSLLKELLARETEERSSSDVSLNDRLDKHGKDICKALSGQQMLVVDAERRGEGLKAIMERISSLEKVLVESEERHTGGIRATKAKLDSFAGHLSAIREAWVQETVPA